MIRVVPRRSEIQQCASQKYNNDIVYMILAKAYLPNSGYRGIFVQLALRHFDRWPSSYVTHQEIHEYIFTVLRLLHGLMESRAQ